MNLVSLRRKFQRSFQREGLGGTLRLAVVNLAELAGSPFRKPTPITWFDEQYKVDTDTWAALSDFDISSPNYAYGQEYAPITVQVFQEALSRIPIDHSRFTFIDLGSGKGRALLLAAALPFRKIIGVEFAEALHRIAIDNIRIYTGPRLCLDIEPVCMDATLFPLPTEPLLILLFNPFVGPTMAHVLHNIEESLRAFPREIIVLYAKPLMASAFASSHCLTEIVAHEHYRIYRSVHGCGPLPA
jgi:hypothetical protein